MTPSFAGSLFPEQRRVIFARMNSHHRQAKSVMEGIEDQNYWNGWSEFAKAIGYQAIFAVATMGCAMGIAALIGRAATWGASALRGALGTGRIGSAISGGTITSAKFVLQGAGKLTTVGRGLKTGKDSAALLKAVYGLFGRLTVGTILLVWSGAESGDGHSRDSRQGSTYSARVRFCFMAFLAVFANPGVRVPSRWVRFLGRLPSATSRQTVLQGLHLARVMMQDLVEGEGSDALWAEAATNASAFTKTLEEVGACSVAGLIEWAVEEEANVELRIDARICQRNFTSGFSYPTYVGMYWSGKVEDYNTLCRTLIIARAKRDFWVRVGRAAEAIEREIRAAQAYAEKRMNQSAAPGGGPAQQLVPVEPVY